MFSEPTAEILKYATSTVSHYLYSSGDEVAVLQNDADRVNAVVYSALSSLTQSTSVRPPKLIVVGTQSSGKSSVLNTLMGIDVLPTGATMTTRCAIQVQLLRDARSRVEFGAYAEGTWQTRRTVALSEPATAEQIQAVHALIREETDRNATNARCVTAVPLHVRVHAPHLAHLAFVDLPGLTMTALTSEGQPDDICEQIRAMVSDYFDERTVVLLVCAARPDLEADAALELCKKLSGGARTLGCLTKSDLCDDPDCVLPYLEGTQSPDLRLDFGYHAVVCRKLGDQARAPERLSARLCRSPRFGPGGLARRVHELLTAEVRGCLPTLRKELQGALDAATCDFTCKLKNSVPETNHGKMSFLSDATSRLLASLTASLTARRPNATAGRRFRESFAVLRQRLRRIDPFAETVDDAEIMQAVHNCEGRGMVSPIPPIEILEFFLQHPSYRPIQDLYEPCETSFDQVHAIVLAAIEDELAEYVCFDNLCAWFRTRLHDEMADERARCLDELRGVTDHEEAYIFTDDASFMKEWVATTQRAPTNANYPSVLRAILASYFSVVADSVAAYAPKVIVHSTNRMLRQFHVRLQGDLQRCDTVAALLYETEETEALRASLTHTIETTRTCIAQLDGALEVASRVA